MPTTHSYRIIDAYTHDGAGPFRVSGNQLRSLAPRYSSDDHARDASASVGTPLAHLRSVMTARTSRKYSESLVELNGIEPSTS